MTKNHISLQLLPLDRRKPLPWRDFGRIAFTSIANLSHLNGMTLVPSKANLLKRAWLVVNFQRFPTLDAKKLVNAPKMSAHHRGICHF